MLSRALLAAPTTSAAPRTIAPLHRRSVLVQFKKPDHFGDDEMIFKYPGVHDGGTSSLSLDEVEGQQRMIEEAAKIAEEAARAKQERTKKALAEASVKPYSADDGWAARGEGLPADKVASVHPARVPLPKNLGPNSQITISSADM